MEHLFFTIQSYGMYLNEHGYDIDLYKPIYENGLFDKLNDYHIGGLSNYFYFQGIAEVTLFDPVETDDTKNTLTYSSVPVIGYFYDEFNELIHFDKSEKNKLTKVFEPYYLSKCFFDFNDIIENTSLALPKNCFDYKIIYTLTLDKKSVSLDNLRVLKKDVIIQKKQINVIDVELKPQLDNLTTENAQLKAKIAELEKQLAQAQQVTPASGDSEGQGDSLLILGAVMDCIKSVAKNNYTQQSLIDEILSKHKEVKSISDSTLKKKFAESKNYLKQRVN